jgi:NADH:ubiquinone oxidoreductase subunit 6 (subunit J)
MFRNLRHVLQSIVWFLILLAALTFVFGGSVNSARLVVVYVVVTLTLAALAYLQKPYPRVHEGWHYLTPSAMEWLGLVGGVTMTLLFLWVYYFVGSARADAASQMFMLKILIVSFAAGTGIVFYTSFAGELRWNDHAIEQRQLFLAAKTIKFVDIVGGGMNPWTQAIWAAGSDGTVIRFSPYANGAEALARTIFQPQLDGPAP